MHPNFTATDRDLENEVHTFKRHIFNFQISFQALRIFNGNVDRNYTNIACDCAPQQSNFHHFHAVFGLKKCQIIGWHPTGVDAVFGKSWICHWEGHQTIVLEAENCIRHCRQ